MLPECPQCGASMPMDAKYCPQCGEGICDSLSTSAGTQLMIYAVSFLLAPFGLYFVFKYLRRSSQKERMIGMVALLLTVLAIGAMIWAGTGLVRYEMRMLDGLGL